MGTELPQDRWARRTARNRERWHTKCSPLNRGPNEMLWTIFVVLLVLWVLGLVTSYTLGGFIHLLLLVAVAVLLIQLITGRRAV
jgi:Family of unknown function (DUF5670)